MKVNLRLIAENLNLPTALKTAILPGETKERLFIATQIGEILYTDKNTLKSFLDIKSKVLRGKGYDERGLIGLAFHPNFNQNGLFYIHYSIEGSQGEKILPGAFKPNPCDLKTLNLKWTDREKKYDHIDTIEEWGLMSNMEPRKRRTILNLRRPFYNHNGFNSLNFSPETGKLVLTTGDGGAGYDPFNLSQNDMEIAGKIIEIDVSKNVFNDKPVSRFDELTVSVKEALTIIAKGVRNISGISYQKFNNTYIKHIGNVGQDLVESIFSFIRYVPVTALQLTDSNLIKSRIEKEGFVNFGWRGWEGILPTSIITSCPGNSNLTEKIFAYYDETVKTSLHTQPLISYFHEDSRSDRISGTAITGVQPYMGENIEDLKDSVVFIDLLKKEKSKSVKGALAYAKIKMDGKPIDYNIIDVDYDFGPDPAYFMSLGTNSDQTRLFLGVYKSMKVADLNKGTIFEIVP